MKITDISVRDFKENARHNEAVINAITSGLDAYNSSITTSRNDSDEVNAKPTPADTSDGDQLAYANLMTVWDAADAAC